MTTDPLERAVRDLSEQERALLAHVAELLPHLAMTTDVVEIRVLKGRDAAAQWQVSRIRRQVVRRQDRTFT